MFQSPYPWDALVEAKIDDLHASRRPFAVASSPSRLRSMIAAARRPVGRALINAGARIAGGETSPARPAAPAHFAA
jgi:hypothetical protein